MKFFQTITFVLTTSCLLSLPAGLEAQSPQVGLGTYYADKYHGRPTASGELYDKYKFTAAHRQLAFGTMVRVTRLDNGRSVVVKVNDRGPFSEGRIIDVSRAAAEQLDLIRTGESQVRIEVVQGQSAGPANASASPPSSTPQPQTTPSGRPTTNYNTENRDLGDLPLRNFGGQPVSESGAVVVGSNGVEAPATPTTQSMSEAEKYTPEFFQFVAYKRDVEGFAIQVGAFFNFYRLMEAMDQLSQKGIQNTILHSALKNDQPVFRILIGPYDSRQEAKSVLQTYSSLGVEGIVVNLMDLR